MNNWLVRYYNGRGQREKMFGSREGAIKFLESCKDNTATLWKKEIVGKCYYSNLKTIPK